MFPPLNCSRSPSLAEISKCTDGNRGQTQSRPRGAWHSPEPETRLPGRTGRERGSGDQHHFGGGDQLFVHVPCLQQQVRDVVAVHENAAVGRTLDLGKASPVTAPV